MNGRWNKFIVTSLIVLWGMLPVATAQQQNLPPLVNIAYIDSVAIFYPEAWIYEPADGFRIAQPDGIEVVAQAITTDVAFDTIPDWMISEELALEADFFTLESYGGVDSWLAQGIRAGQFSGTLAIPLDEASVLVVQTTFPEEQLAEDAPLITAIFENLIVLPQAASAQNLDFQLPATWVSQPTDVGAFIMLSDDDDISATLETADAEALDELLFDAAEQEQQTFWVNDVPTTAQLALVDDEPVLRITQPRGDRVIVLTVSAEEADDLVEKLAYWQAIVASVV